MSTTTIKAPAYETGARAPLWEQGILFLWFFATIASVMPLKTLILYACVLYFVARIALNHYDYVSLAGRVWPILLLPFFGALSYAWTPFKGAAIQTIVYQLLTFMIIMVIVQRYQLDQIFRAILLAGLAMLVVHYSQGGGATTLPYHHKNQLSLHAVLVAVLALWAIVDRHQPLWLKVAAGASIPVCVLIVFGAESATGLVLLFMGLIAWAASVFVWSNAAGVRYMRAMIVLLSSATIILAILIVLRLPVAQMFSEFLTSLGKDATLTGRTELWKYADEISDQHPILGVGVSGFWQNSVGAAQGIMVEFYKRPGDVFNFHNTFLEVRVHLGYIGLALLLFSLGWALWRHVHAFVQQARPIDCTAFVLALLVMTTAFTESAIWGNFNLYMHLLYLPAIAAFGASQRKYIGEVTVKISDSGDGQKPKIVLAE